MDTRINQYLRYAAGDHSVELPEPITRTEFLLIALIEAIEQGGGSTYELPPASTSTLGGVKSNSSGGAFTVDGEGNVTINVSQYTLPAATTSALGGVKSDAVNGMFTVDANGVVTINGYTKAQSDALIAAITALIPNQATTQNQLADKNFVNSSVATNTAHFIDTFDSVAELEAYSGTKTNNDYAFVVVYDETEPTQVKQYDRYKYNGSAWAFEYTLNNSSFTAEQWATISSGITKALADSIVGKYVKPSGGIPASDLAQAIQTSLGKADTAVQPGALATVATSGSYNDLSNTPTIPDELADLSDDSTHRVVTDIEKATWNGKARFLELTKTTWAGIHAVLDVLAVNEVGLFFASGSASGAAAIITSNKLTVSLKGYVTRTQDDMFDFFATAGAGDYAYGWRISNATSNNMTVGTVYRYSGTAV